MKIRFIVMWSKVRSLCIRENYYTKGNNKEYEYLLFTLCDKGTTLNDILKIATDIYNHSEKEILDKKYKECNKDTVKVIAEYIINECSYVTIN